MNRFRKVFTFTGRTGQLAVNHGKAFWFVVPIAFIAWVVLSIVHAQSPLRHGFSPTPERLTVLRNDNLQRCETLELRAKGLRPNAGFAVFLASDYLGEITANADGRGSMRANAAFSGTPGDPGRAVLLFANPSGDDLCFTPVKGLAERNALLQRNVPPSRAASVATTFITEAISMNDASLFHTINWRSISCVSTF